MRSTGPILAVGAITMANETIVAGKPIDWRVPIATGIAAGALALVEHAWEDGAVALAWLSLVSVLLVRVRRDVPSPVESFYSWYTGKPILISEGIGARR